MDSVDGLTCRRLKMPKRMKFSLTRSPRFAGIRFGAGYAQAIEKHCHLTPKALLHSEQGFHYTHPTFQKLVKKMKLGQSMSRRGSCWDNAPQEFFFGHLKLKACQTLQQVKQEVKRYMRYYNLERGQWTLKKLPPARYRQQLLYVSFIKSTVYRVFLSCFKSVGLN